MPLCPQCTKPLRELVRRCPSCQADLDLLVDYVSHLAGGLERAENLTRAGELGQAVWAYLAILDVDPDNAAAKKQVGQVVTAVRQFDVASPGRRLHLSRGEAPAAADKQTWRRWVLGVVAAALVLLSFWIGFWVGTNSFEPTGDAPPPVEKKPNDRLGG